MGMHKKILQIIAVGVSVVVMGTSAYTENPELVEIMDEVCALNDSTTVLIKETADDLTVIPDKYNTGAKGSLTVAEIGTTVDGIQFTSANNNARNVLDFAYRNKKVSGVVTFNDVDFSNYQLWSYNENMVDRTIKVEFNNCKFSHVAVGKEKGNISFEFNNCTIGSFNGSNAVFNSCRFGGSYTDGIVPFQNVEVNNCFIADMAKMATGGEIHTDGTQIYGKQDIDVCNVFYNNCRYELPPLDVAGSSAYVNACIMLQLEYSNARNVSFKNSIVNGGGYSIYAWDKGKGYTFDNVSIEGVRSGCAKDYGTIYSKFDEKIKLSGVEETDSLYIASVWKTEGETHFSVSNDTNVERKLLVCTAKGKYEFVIPACPSGAEMKSGATYEEMPFDLDIVVPEDCEYAVCFDNTMEGYAQQIRFVNWSGQNVYLEKSFINALTANGEDVILSGSCGAAATFSITKSGKMVIEGSGNMTNYNSKKLSPWSEYNNFIKTIEVEEGIVRIGEQAFRGCISVQSVSLPTGLKEIGQRAFSGCTSLSLVSVPSSVESIGASAFSSAFLQEVRYGGDNWNDIALGSGNEALAEKVVYVQEIPEEISNIILQGSCGRQAEFVLTDDGVLRITGVGTTYNYNSMKTAPWYESRDLIKVVQVESGIEKVGEQLFRNCKNLQRVKLSNGLSVIGKNAFISCSSLEEIMLTKSITEIQQRAFSGVKQVQVAYGGSESDWQDISIAPYNNAILENVHFQ